MVSFGDVSVAFAYRGTDGSLGSRSPGRRPPSPTSPRRRPPPTGKAPPSPTRAMPAASIRARTSASISRASGRPRSTADIDDGRSRSRSKPNVRPSSPSPASRPRGSEALKTENLTLDSKGVEPVSIDSRAQDGDPDPGSRAPRMDDRRGDRSGTPRALSCSRRRSTASADSAARRSRPWSSSPPTTRTRPCSSTWRSGATTTKSVLNQGAADWLLSQRRSHRALAVPDRRRRHDRRPVGTAVRPATRWDSVPRRRLPDMEA